VAVGGQTSPPWPLSRSVIAPVGLAGAESARIADYALRLTAGTVAAVSAPIVQFGSSLCAG